MRIGFDAKRAFHNFTGLGNYSRFIVHALQNHYPEHDYHLFSPTLQINEETKVLKDNFNVHQAPGIYQKAFLKSLWRSFGIANIIKKKPLDIYHGLSNELPVSMTPGVKQVVTIHDLIFLRYPELFSFIDRKIYGKKFKAACEKADKIIAISEQTKKDIQEYFQIDGNRIKVLYQGCHENFIRQTTPDQLAAIKKKYNLPKEFILNVGTIEQRKNALVILKALIAGNIKVPLVIVGRATSYKKELLKYIKENNLDQQVLFLHHVEFKDLPGIYDQSLLFLYPSVFEGFGIPVIEALHRKVPVITSTGSCFSEAGGDMAVYVDPRNEDELAAAINASLSTNDKPSSEQIDQHLYRFSTKKIATDYIDLYKELL